MSEQIKRSMYYYNMFSLVKDGKTYAMMKSQNYLYKFFSLLKEEQSKSNDYQDFVESTSRGETIIYIDRQENNNFYFRIALCRENALPYIEKNGQLESLGSYIGNDQNIAEVTHCVFFSDYCILGVEYNYNGPRCSLIPEYISKRDEDAPVVQCHPKLNYDAYEKLLKDEEYSLFEFAFSPDSKVYTEFLSSKSIFNIFQKATPEADIIEVCIKKRKTKRNEYKGFTLPFQDQEIKKLLDKYRDDIKKFIVSQDKLSEGIDLLSDKFVGKVTLIKTKDRTIDADAMYLEIYKYFELRVKEYCDRRSEDVS